jgi:hypothetical protein
MVDEFSAFGPHAAAGDPSRKSRRGDAGGAGLQTAANPEISYETAILIRAGRALDRG